MQVGGVPQVAQVGDNPLFFLRGLTAGTLDFIGPIPTGSSSFTSGQLYAPGEYSIEAPPSFSIGGQSYSGNGGTTSQSITNADITFTLNF